MLRRFQPHPFQFLVVFAIAAALFSPSMHGQAPTPSPVAGTQPGASSSITTLHTYSNLVVIDVVVDDAKGNPIHGLKASDFDFNREQQAAGDPELPGAHFGGDQQGHPSAEAAGGYVQQSVAVASQWTGERASARLP